jgi:hypothetical protein
LAATCRTALVILGLLSSSWSAAGQTTNAAENVAAMTLTTGTLTLSVHAADLPLLASKLSNVNIYNWGRVDLAAPQSGPLAWHSDSATAPLGAADFTSVMDGEVVPVAEAGTWVAAALACGALCFMQRRRLRKFLPLSKSARGLALSFRSFADLARDMILIPSHLLLRNHETTCRHKSLTT